MTVENNHRWPVPNHNYVPEYQMSGVPFVSTYKSDNAWQKITINFDQVTRWLQILNHNDNGNNHIFLFFNGDEATTFIANNSKPAVYSGTAGSKHIRIDKSSYSIRYELKCKSIYIVTENADSIFSVIAGLTNVPSNTFPDQTKLNGFTGVQS